MRSPMHEFYEAIPEEDRYLFRSAVSAMLEHWYAGSNLQYYKKRLMESGSDSVVSKDELDELHAAIEQSEKDIEALTSDKDALITTNRQVMKDQKMILAQVLVTSNVLLGKSGFTGLTSDQVQKEIADRSGRKLNSLQDSLADLLKEIPGVSLQVASGKTPSEGAVREVSDSAKVDTDAGPAKDAGDLETPSTDGVSEEVTDSGERTFLVATKILGGREVRRLATRAAFQARRKKT